MSTTTAKAREHQAQWNDVVRDPALKDLPYTVETNSRGQIVLSPHSFRHSRLQRDVYELLRRHAPEGQQLQECPMVTEAGTKQVDVVWMSSERRTEMEETGDPPTLAPEICIEVMSESNSWDEMEGKRMLYLEAGAEEVWVLDEDGQIWFFAEEEMEQSQIAPDVPDHV